MPESVMIVEDEGLVALELEECLRQMGYKVPSVVASGAEAIARAAEIKPDLILMDIRLKGEMDGIEAARQIMGAQAIPVVYLTAHSDDATVRRARETAPFGYVLKPWEEKSLQIAIDLALHKARTEADIKNERDWYLSILRYTGAPMLVCGTDGTVRFLNAGGGAVARRRGSRRRRPAARGRLWTCASSPARRPLDALAASRARRASRRLHAETPSARRRYSGFRSTVTTVPIMGEAGADLGFLFVMRPQPAGQAGHTRPQAPCPTDEPRPTTCRPS